MSNPKLRVRSSGYSGSGYGIGARVGDPYREMNNADKEPIKVRLGPDGKALVYPGVTTILKLLEKPGVVNWAVERTLDWANENFAYLGSHSDEQVMRAGRYRWRDALDERSNLGTDVHGWAETLFNGWFDYPDLTPEGESAVQSLLTLLDNVEISALATEVTVVSHKHGYAGTLDLLALIKGLLALVDLKTSKGLWWEHELQLAALANADCMIVEVEDGFWEEIPMPTFDTLTLIQLRGDYWDPRTKTVVPAFYNVHNIEPEDWDLHFQAFLGILKTAQVKRELKERKKARGHEENF